MKRGFGKLSAFDGDDSNEDEPVKRKRPEELLHGEVEEDQQENEEDDEIDPLDAFMMGVEKQVQEEKAAPAKAKVILHPYMQLVWLYLQIVRAEFEEEDMIESLMKHVEKEKAKEKEKERAKGGAQSEDLVEEIEYVGRVFTGMINQHILDMIQMIIR